ncbi:MAG: hypothetical protein V1909_02620 [Candidatus Micrarchaeota archaeon]
MSFDLNPISNPIIIVILLLGLIVKMLLETETQRAQIDIWWMGRDEARAIVDKLDATFKEQNERYEKNIQYAVRANERFEANCDKMAQLFQGTKGQKFLEYYETLRDINMTKLHELEEQNTALQEELKTANEVGEEQASEYKDLEEQHEKALATIQMVKDAKPQGVKEVQEEEEPEPEEVSPNEREARLKLRNYIAEFYKANDNHWPHVNDIKAKVGMSPTRVIKILKRMADCGELVQLETIGNQLEYRLPGGVVPTTEAKPPDEAVS